MFEYHLIFVDEENEKAQEKVTINGTKTWVDPKETVHSEITINLMRDNIKFDTVKLSNGTTSYEFKNLDVDDYILKLYLPNNYELLEENDKNFINKQLLISKKINNQNNIDIPIKLKKTFSVKGVVFLEILLINLGL